MKTYLVGRKNNRIQCDIEIPESERSVSRKHLELTISDNGECYLVHIHQQNITEVWDANAQKWQPLSQQYVGWDDPLMLGSYRTTARQLLDLMGGGSTPAPVYQQPETPESTPRAGAQVYWDPDSGTFVSR